MDLVVSVIVGVASGVLASILFWYVQFRVFRVSLRLSPTVARYLVETSPFPRYQVKVVNHGRRDAIDLEVMVRILLRNFAKTGATETLSLTSWHRPELKVGTTVLYLITPTRLDDASRRWYERYFDPSLREALDRGGEVSLDDLLAYSDSYELRVYVFATDAFSGARTLEKAVYTHDDVRVGRFVKGTFRHTGELFRRAPDDEPSGNVEQAESAERGARPEVPADEGSAT